MRRKSAKTSSEKPKLQHTVKKDGSCSFSIPARSRFSCAIVTRIATMYGSCRRFFEVIFVNLRLKNADKVLHHGTPSGH